MPVHHTHDTIGVTIKTHYHCKDSDTDREHCYHSQLCGWWNTSWQTRADARHIEGTWRANGHSKRSIESYMNLLLHSSYVPLRKLQVGVRYLHPILNGLCRRAGHHLAERLSVLLFLLEGLHGSN